MALEERLASELIEMHPERAVATLERLDPDSVVSMLERGEADLTAQLLERLSPGRADAVLGRLGNPRLAELFASLESSAATRLARRLDPDRREAVLDAMPSREGRFLRTALRFDEDSAGAWMDPRIMALPEDFTAAEALARIREQPECSHYNLYVVDGQQKLVGVLNLREIFVAEPNERLRVLMRPKPLSLHAGDDRARIVAHPGWREVHSLPVVDDEGAYLGAVRYRTLRTLEGEMFKARRRDVETPAALGELFAAGAGGLLDALSGATRAQEV